jgi:hypothetical protein
MAFEFILSRGYTVGSNTCPELDHTHASRRESSHPFLSYGCYQAPFHILDIQHFFFFPVLPILLMWLVKDRLRRFTCHVD